MAIKDTENPKGFFFHDHPVIQKIVSELIAADLEGYQKLLDDCKQAEEQPKPFCLHHSVTASYEHVTCRTCGAVRTGSHEDRWGVAKSTWFKNLAEAEFYKENGRLPE